MKYLIGVLFVCVFLTSLGAQSAPSDPNPSPSTCSQLNSNENLVGTGDVDKKEHAGGFHGVSIDQPRTQCSYTHGSTQYCITQCDLVNGSANLFNGGLHSGEVGPLSVGPGVHGVAVNWLSGQNTGMGDASPTVCSGRLIGGAVHCRDPLKCDVTAVYVPELGKVIVTNGTSDPVIWNNQGISVSGVCQSLPDPQNQRADAGGPTADDPCVNSTDPTVVGPEDGFNSFSPTGCPPSPIIIDAEGEGFHLTSTTNGVVFDIRADGHPLQIAWTDPKYHNAFLVLDRNGDGKISSGAELFGNFTIQDRSRHPNGFLALAEFDEPDQGGNGDGVIDERDAVFSKLRLWIDENHDGISQPNELHKLSEFGIYSLTLSYFESRKQDEFGNQFRYRARVNPDQKHRDARDETKSGEPGRWAYDVFFTTK